MPSQNEIRQQVTEQIIKALEKGTPPWRRPWNSTSLGRHRNAISDRAYSGVNPWLLELHSHDHGFTSRCWGTFRQWKDLGCNVKKRPDHVAPGAWGCTIVFTKPVKKTVEDKETGKVRDESFRILRTYCVFNADQVEGEAVDQFRAATPASDRPDFEPVEELIQATGVELYLGGDRAFYRRPMPQGSWPHHSDGDCIQVPHKSDFDGIGGYYETVLHELAHWSEVRLGWSGSYAMGELVAEMASCFLSQELGVPQGEGLVNRAAYLNSWLSEMKNDHSFIFKASTQASKVTDFLMSFSRSLDAVQF